MDQWGPLAWQVSPNTTHWGESNSAPQFKPWSSFYKSFRPRKPHWTWVGQQVRRCQLTARSSPWMALELDGDQLNSKVSGDSSRHPAGSSRDSSLAPRFSNTKKLCSMFNLATVIPRSNLQPLTLPIINCSASGYNFNASPVSLPLQRSLHSSKPMHRWKSFSFLYSDLDLLLDPVLTLSKFNPLGNGEARTSVEDLSSFLTAMDSCIAINKKASISLIKSSK